MDGPPWHAVSGALSASEQVYTVTAEGEIDLAAAEDLRATLVDALTSPAALVVVDLGATTFLDSTGTGTVVTAWKRLVGQGRRLVVANATGQPLRVLALLGLDKALEVWSADGRRSGAPSGDAPAARQA